MASALALHFMFFFFFLFRSRCMVLPAHLNQTASVSPTESCVVAYIAATTHRTRRYYSLFLDFVMSVRRWFVFRSFEGCMSRFTQISGRRDGRHFLPGEGFSCLCLPLVPPGYCCCSSHCTLNIRIVQHEWLVCRILARSLGIDTRPYSIVWFICNIIFGVCLPLASRLGLFRLEEVLEEVRTKSGT